MRLGLKAHNAAGVWKLLKKVMTKTGLTRTKTRVDYL